MAYEERAEITKIAQTVVEIAVEIVMAETAMAEKWAARAADVVSPQKPCRFAPTIIHHGL